MTPSIAIMYYIRVTEGKIEKIEKKAKLVLVCTQKFKTLVPIAAEKYVTEISIGEKEMNK